MSVRVVAVRGVPRARLRVVPRIVTPAAPPNVGTIGGGTVGPGFWARLTDDTQHVQLKLVVLGALVLLAMALEVPR